MDYTEILIKIRKIVRSLNLESKQIQKDFGISIPQFLILRFLADNDEFKATHSQICAHLELNKSTVTGIISRLEKKGYIAKLPKMGDKRVVYISLTSTGFQIIQNSPQLLHDRISKKLKQLPENEIESINKTLDILINSLDIADMPASPVITIDDPIDMS